MAERRVVEESGPPAGGQLIPADALLMTGSALGEMTRAEVDVQIATAKAYKRSETESISKAESLALLNEGIAEQCMYALPRAGATLVGPSVRLAEIVAYSWQNLRYGARTVQIDDRFVTAQGFCADLEKNIACMFEVKRRIRNKEGHRFTDDMIGVTANAAGSIAMRNAIFKVVPFAFVRPIYEKCKQLVSGEGKTFEQRRADCLKKMASYSFTPDEVCQMVGKKHVNDISGEDFLVLTGIYQSLAQETTTPAEIRENLRAGKEQEAAPAAGAGRTGELEGRLAGGNGTKKDDAPPATAPPPAPIGEAKPGELDEKIAQARDVLGLTQAEVDARLARLGGDKGKLYEELVTEAVGPADEAKGAAAAKKGGPGRAARGR